MQAATYLARSKKRRLAGLNEDFAKLYSQAAERLRARQDLTDIDTYVSSCLVFMRHQADMRILRDMLMHLGRVMGHDKRTISVDDRRSYRDVLEALQAELQVIDVQPTVKDDADAAAPAPARDDPE